LVAEELLIKGKITYRLLFSTDTLEAPIDVTDIYHTRFQIEFGFCGAKQLAGLENSQARSGIKLYFHFNTALTTVNYCQGHAIEQYRYQGKLIFNGNIQSAIPQQLNAVPIFQAVCHLT